MVSKEVIKEIQDFSQKYIFDNILKNKKLHQYSQEYKKSWLNRIGESKSGIGSQKASRKTLKEIQNHIEKIFGKENIISEKEVEPFHYKGEINLAFDLHIPKEETAIEICLSALTHEFEKDTLKALEDSKTKTLYFGIREISRGAGVKAKPYGGQHFGMHCTKQPRYQLLIDTARVYELDVKPFNICPIP